MRVLLDRGYRYMRFLREHKFNALRLLFNHQSVLDGAMLDPPNTKWCAEHGVAVCAWEAPELEGYSYLDMFLKLAQVRSGRWPCGFSATAS